MTRGACSWLDSVTSAAVTAGALVVAAGALVVAAGALVVAAGASTGTVVCACSGALQSELARSQLAKHHPYGILAQAARRDFRPRTGAKGTGRPYCGSHDVRSGKRRADPR